MRPAPGAPSSWLRRLLDTKAATWGGYGGSTCVGPRCADRTSVLATLATLNAQDAVRRAADGNYGPAGTYLTTQAAQRSAVAASYGDLQYLSQPGLYWPGAAYAGKR
jgi:hypothetical protein